MLHFSLHPSSIPRSASLSVAVRSGFCPCTDDRSLRLSDGNERKLDSFRLLESFTFLFFPVLLSLSPLYFLYRPCTFSILLLTLLPFLLQIASFLLCSKYHIDTRFVPVSCPVLSKAWSLYPLLALAFSVFSIMDMSHPHIPSTQSCNKQALPRLPSSQRVPVKRLVIHLRPRGYQLRGFTSCRYFRQNPRTGLSSSKHLFPHHSSLKHTTNGQAKCKRNLSTIADKDRVYVGCGLQRGEILGEGTCGTVSKVSIVRWHPSSLLRVQCVLLFNREVVAVKEYKPREIGSFRREIEYLMGYAPTGRNYLISPRIETR